MKCAMEVTTVTLAQQGGGPGAPSKKVLNVFVAPAPLTAGALAPADTCAPFTFTVEYTEPNRTKYAVGAVIVIADE